MPLQRSPRRRHRNIRRTLMHDTVINPWEAESKNLRFRRWKGKLPTPEHCGEFVSKSTGAWELSPPQDTGSDETVVAIPYDVLYHAQKTYKKSGHTPTIEDSDVFLLNPGSSQYEVYKVGYARIEDDMCVPDVLDKDD